MCRLKGIIISLGILCYGIVPDQDVFIGVKPIDSVNVQILVNNEFSNSYPKPVYIPLSLDSAKSEIYRQLYVNCQLTKAFEYRTDKMEEQKYYYSIRTEDQNISILLRNFIKIPLMQEVFDEIVPFVSTKKKKDQFHLKVFDNNEVTEYQDPLVLVDGVPVFNINEIMKTPPELVEKIDVNNRKYYLGSNLIEGIIRITTKTKDLAGISFPNESVFLKCQTVNIQSYPIFPSYKSTIKSRMPDFRILLYWQPFLKPEKGKAKISFYTSDDCGKYNIIIKGYDNGSLCYGNVSFEVKK